MARKKSAAKRAREAAAKNDTENNDVDVLVKKSAADTIKKDITSESEEDESTSSEEEDEYGELITERVEEGIEKVLQTIRNEPKKLLDPDVKFFDDSIETTTSKQDKSKDKPIYLKDYHRMNLLAGGYKDEELDDNEYGTVDGEKPYTLKQKEEKDQLLSEIKKAFDNDVDADDDDDEDDFLKKKERKREVEDIPMALPDPKENSEEFLKAFLDNQSWIPKKGDKIINLDKIDREAEEDFEDAVENFEHAYNFRYEDANAAEIVSYARNQATLRRSNTNSRKRQREKKIESKIKEKEETEALLKKKKNAKVNQVMDRLAKVKEAVGDDVSDEVIQKVFGDSLLNDDFDDADWDNKMAQIFDEQYYQAEIEKPNWDEDDEIMADFMPSAKDDKSSEIQEIESEVDTSKKSKKDKLKDKKSLKKEKESLKEKAHEIVEANTSRLLDEIDEERGRSLGKSELKFKYREVSPETFGLSTREILLADDKQLNQFIGIKKFAPYRPRELRMKDKRKYTKKKHLQEWRKETFNNKNGPEVKEDSKHDIWIEAENEPVKKKKKSKSRN